VGILGGGFFTDSVEKETYSMWERKGMGNFTEKGRGEEENKFFSKRGGGWGLILRGIKGGRRGVFSFM